MHKEDFVFHQNLDLAETPVTSLNVLPPDDKLPPRGRLWRVALFTFFMLLLLVVGVLAVKAGITFQVVSQGNKNVISEARGGLPVADPREYNRLDVLLLGMRGEGDPHGGILTDSLTLISVKTDSGKVAMVSIPRDTWVQMPLVKKGAKINEAYELGERFAGRGGGLTLAKLAAEEVTGVNIDYAVLVDFEAFREAIEILGGVQVLVERPLREHLQWGGIDFLVEAGPQRMDSEKALYYIRSRFTTSDFDRARRLHEVLIAIKNKAFALGFFSNPAKVYTMLDALGRHVRTDVNLADASKLFELAKRADTKHIIRFVLSTEDKLLHSQINAAGAYVLLPEGGDFSRIRVKIRRIFDTEQPAAAVEKQSL